MPDISTGGLEGSSDAAILREMQKRKQRQPVAKNGKTPLVRKSGYDALDKNSFLKLLVTQLSKQDPTNPMNDREFISQMAQFSSLEQMNNVANSMHKLRNTQANGLIGKMVEGKDFVTEKPLQGIVTSALYEPNGDVLLKIGGRYTKFDDITSVTDVSRETMPQRPLDAPRAMPIGGDQAARAYEANQIAAPVVVPNKAAPAEVQPARAAEAPAKSSVEARSSSAVETRSSSGAEMPPHKNLPIIK